MDREFGILLLNACYRASREMGEMGVMIKEFSPGEDGHKVKMEIGMAIAEIGRVTESVFRAHPDLEAYIESQIEKFGRVS